ncbi:metal-dependent hydrolase [Candidatus Babeliales bacterium]|nr:metal-dependent hydrolase [Candidatus Babeliales bacterium]
MPGYRQHLLGGTVSFLALYHWGPSILQASPESPSLIFVAFCATLIGSLFPDIDTKSMIQMTLYQALFLFFVIAIFMNSWHELLICAPLSIFPLVVHHRGIMHHPLFLIALTTAACGFITIYKDISPSITFFIGSYFIIGCLSHLLLDFGFSHTKDRFLLKNKK